MKAKVLNSAATSNNNIDIAAFEKHIQMLERASFHLDESEFFYEFGMYPQDIARLQEELQILKQGGNKVEKPITNKINRRRLRAAVKREMINLLYPRFTKTRILKEFRSEVFADLSAFEKFFDSNYKLFPHFRPDFQDEVYRRIME